MYDHLPLCIRDTTYETFTCRLTSYVLFYFLSLWCLPRPVSMRVCVSYSQESLQVSSVLSSRCCLGFQAISVSLVCLPVRSAPASIFPSSPILRSAACSGALLSSNYPLLSIPCPVFLIHSASSAWALSPCLRQGSSVSQLHMCVSLLPTGSLPSLFNQHVNKKGN